METPIRASVDWCFKGGNPRTGGNQAATRTVAGSGPANLAASRTLRTASD